MWLAGSQTYILPVAFCSDSFERGVGRVKDATYHAVEREGDGRRRIDRMERSGKDMERREG